MLYLFLDTNTFLSFYEFSSADLSELEKLAELIDFDEIKLLLPNQTVDEFIRKRELKIQYSINEIRKNKLTTNFPQLVKNYSEYNDLIESIKVIEKVKKKIIGTILNEEKTNELKADKIIDKIFKNAIIIDVNNEIINNARIRFDKGNPPGKGSKLGDQIIWESLLFFEFSEDLHIVSSDSDYKSILSKDINPFLKKEWENKKQSNAFLYIGLTSFFKENFPDIKLNDLFTKEKLIKDLASARNFASAKYKLNELSKYTEFNNNQLNNIIEAAITNNQIYWIRDDYGVGSFLVPLYNENKEIIDNDFKSLFEQLYLENENKNDKEEEFLI
jgi:hypothetical protein